MSETRPDTEPVPPYWGRGRWIHGAELPPGAELSQLRQGLGREPGSAPGMWPHYTRLTGAGEVTPALHAEHVALTLFGVHQQSAGRLVHRRGNSVGAAASALRRSGRYSEDAVDRRMAASAGASTLGSLAVHLRGLVQQLSVVEVTLDYDRLFEDLVHWQSPSGSSRVRRRWGGDFYAAAPRSTPSDPPPAVPIQQDLASGDS